MPDTPVPTDHIRPKSSTAGRYTFAGRVTSLEVKLRAAPSVGGGRALCIGRLPTGTGLADQFQQRDLDDYLRLMAGRVTKENRREHEQCYQDHDFAGCNDRY